MNKFLPLLLCLVLSIFTIARATKPTHMAIPNKKTAHNEEADAKTLLNDANTGEEVPSDGDDSTEPASSEDVNDDGGGNAPGDEDTGDDDAGDEMEAMAAVVITANKTNGNLVPSRTTSRLHLASARSLQYS